MDTFCAARSHKVDLFPHTQITIPPIIQSHQGQIGIFTRMKLYSKLQDSVRLVVHVFDFVHVILVGSSSRVVVFSK